MDPASYKVLDGAPENTFLSAIEDLIDWQRVYGAAGSHGYADTGADVAPESLVRALVLAHWYRLSDKDLEQALTLRVDFIHFCSEPEYRLPDQDELSRFRDGLARSGHYATVLKEVGSQLRAKGMRVRKTSAAVRDPILAADNGVEGASPTWFKAPVPTSGLRRAGTALLTLCRSALEGKRANPGRTTDLWRIRHGSLVPPGLEIFLRRFRKYLSGRGSRQVEVRKLPDETLPRTDPESEDSAPVTSPCDQESSWGRKLDWSWATVTVRGASHVEANEVNQDSVFAGAFDSTDGPVFVGVVCDGAGSAKYSHLGSRTAVAKAAELAEEYLAGGHSVNQLCDAVAETWLRSVRRELVARAGRVGAEPEDLASTLTMVLAGVDDTVIIQVGDCVCVVDMETCWDVPVWPMKGEYANQTWFVTQDPLKSWKMERLPRGIDRVAVISDGLERLVLFPRKREVFQPFFESVFGGFGKTDTAEECERFISSMARFLDSGRINDLTSDDKTLAIAVRR